ncbi:MAG: thioredoxin domain-containing protein [Nitrospinae bacterium]|nr:thioredoxin domain-containing protein [Nitrospinota bacterium]
MKKNSQSAGKDYLKIALYAVALFGVALTIVTELSHYYQWILEACGGESSGCADVASTPFSKIFGVSVAYWGLVSYVAFIVALRYLPALVLPMAAFMLGAEFYFLWIMASIIKIYCLFCLIQFGTVVILFIVTVAWAWKRAGLFPKELFWATPLIVLIAFAGFAAPVKFSSKKAEPLKTEMLTYEGDPKSILRVEVFSDYECGHCKKMEPEIEKLRSARPDILIVYRDYIIESHRISPVAVSYVNAIAMTKGREAFLTARKSLFQNQDRLYDFLQMALPSVVFTDELKDKISAKVAADRSVATALGIYQTPTMVIYRGSELVQKISGYTQSSEIERFLTK